MAYFLKKTNLKKGLYLQIYESFYDPVKKNTAHSKLYPVKRTLEKNQSLVPRFMGSFFDIL